MCVCVFTSAKNTEELPIFLWLKTKPLPDSRHPLYFPYTCFQPRQSCSEDNLIPAFSSWLFLLTINAESITLHALSALSSQLTSVFSSIDSEQTILSYNTLVYFVCFCVGYIYIYIQHRKIYIFNYYI